MVSWYLAYFKSPWIKYSKRLQGKLLVCTFFPKCNSFPSFGFLNQTSFLHACQHCSGSKAWCIYPLPLSCFLFLHFTYHSSVTHLHWTILLQAGERKNPNPDSWHGFSSPPSCVGAPLEGENLPAPSAHRRICFLLVPLLRVLHGASRCLTWGKIPAW